MFTRNNCISMFFTVFTGVYAFSVLIIFIICVCIYLYLCILFDKVECSDNQLPFYVRCLSFIRFFSFSVFFVNDNSAAHQVTVTHFQKLFCGSNFRCICSLAACPPFPPSIPYSVLFFRRSPDVYDH